jgi:hypothetical protein
LFVKRRYVAVKLSRRTIKRRAWCSNKSTALLLGKVNKIKTEFLPHKKHTIMMLSKEKISVYCWNLTKHINAVRQNAGYFNIK